MRRLGRRIVAMTGVIAIACMTSLALTQAMASPAQAATGELTLSPNPGTNVNAAAIESPRACSSGATYVQSRLEGAGFANSAPDPVQQGYGYNITGNSPIASNEQTASGGLRIPLLLTFQAAADLQVPPAPLSGLHTITLRCKNVSPNSTIYDTFVVKINFVSPTKYLVVAGNDAASATPSAGSPQPSGSDAGSSTSSPDAPSSAPATGDATTSEEKSSSRSPSSPDTPSVPVNGDDGRAPVSSESTTAATQAQDAVSPTSRVATAQKQFANSPSRPRSSLPRTGTNPYAMTAYAALLIAAGVLAVIFARRRGFLSFGKD